MSKWWYNKEFVYWPTGTPRQTFLYWMAMFATVLILLGVLFGISKAYSAPAPQACEGQFYNKEMPDYDLAVMQGNDPSKSPDQIYTICFSQFGLQNSVRYKIPLWSAEHLTQDRLIAAKTIKRKDQFHPEITMPVDDRASLADYVGKGYDRGHMSPDADMPDALSMYESFTLANMVPQHPCNNEIIWKNIEISVRSYVRANGEVYVITGPILGGSATIGTSQVSVPTKIFKAIYDPLQNSVLVVVTENANVITYDSITLDQLKDLTGVDAFPSVREGKAPSILALPPLFKMSGLCKKEVTQ
jgi:endonuclease G